MEARLLGSPCHAGHTAGCHHGTFSSPLCLCMCCCCSIQLCGRTPPCPIITSVALIGSSAHRQFCFPGESRTRTAWTRSEVRGGRRGHFGSPSVTGNGAPRTRRGETGGASRSFMVFVLFIKLLGFKRRKREISQARRSFVLNPDFYFFFFALIWQISLPDRPTPGCLSSPALPSLPCCFRAYSPPSHPLYGLLSNLLFS